MDECIYLFIKFRVGHDFLAQFQQPDRFFVITRFRFRDRQKIHRFGILRLQLQHFFQSFFGQVSTDLKTGTNVRTIFRLSPQATVFAIDPFKGRLAIYDPGLSVFVTQHLPNLGLPFRAEAIIDARNIFDFQAGIFGEESGLRVNAMRRMLRGGIQVRF